MKLTSEFLRKCITEELKLMKLFGQEVDVKDVEAKEIKAKDLANTLVAKKDFTVEECVNRTKILNIVETRLLTRLASVRKEKEELVATISHKE